MGGEKFRARRTLIVGSLALLAVTTSSCGYVRDVYVANRAVVQDGEDAKRSKEAPKAVNLKKFKFPDQDEGTSAYKLALEAAKKAAVDPTKETTAQLLRNELLEHRPFSLNRI